SASDSCSERGHLCACSRGGMAMTVKVGSVLIGVFEDQQQALAAARELRQVGFAEEQIGLASRRWIEAVPESAQVQLQQEAGKGAAAGAVVGGGVGLAAGALAAGLIPGVGPALAGGLLLGSTALGAAAGTFAGPFVALGVSESDAQEYARHVEQGRTVVLVRPG